MTAVLADKKIPTDKLVVAIFEIIVIACITVYLFNLVSYERARRSPNATRPFGITL